MASSLIWVVDMEFHKLFFYLRSMYIIRDIPYVFNNKEGKCWLPSFFLNESSWICKQRRFYYEPPHLNQHGLKSSLCLMVWTKFYKSAFYVSHVPTLVIMKVSYNTVLLKMVTKYPIIAKILRSGLVVSWSYRMWKMQSIYVTELKK